MTIRGASPEPASREPASGATSAALHLLAPVAVFALLAGVVLALDGPSESAEGGLWAAALSVALPVGLLLAGRQVRALDGAPAGAASWAVALAIAAFAGPMLVRYGRDGGRAEHLLIALGGLLALVIAPALGRESRLRARLLAAPRVAPALLAAWSLALLALPFLPDGALDPRRLVPTVAIVGIVAPIVLLTWRALPSRRVRRALDVLALVVFGLAVLTFPDLHRYATNLVHHQNFYLGPANDVLHGRTMLVDDFSQYGVGAIDALALVFGVVPASYGGLALVLTLGTAALYGLLYIILRAAIPAPALVVFAMAPSSATCSCTATPTSRIRARDRCASGCPTWSWRRPSSQRASPRGRAVCAGSNWPRWRWPRCGVSRPSSTPRSRTRRWRCWRHMAAPASDGAPARPRCCGAVWWRWPSRWRPSPGYRWRPSPSPGRRRTGAGTSTTSRSTRPRARASCRSRGSPWVRSWG